MKNKIKLFLTIAFISMSVSACSVLNGTTNGSSSQSGNITLTDINPTFGELGKHIAITGVSYPTIGDTKYDSFFKQAAKTYGLVQVGQSATQSTGEGLKEMAIEAAKNALIAEGVKKITGGVSSSEWTYQQEAEIVKLALKKGTMSSDKISGYATTGASLLTVVSALKQGTTTVPELLLQAASLGSGVTSLSADKAPAATAAVATTISNLNDAKSNASKVITNITALANAYKIIYGK
jgi:hypothetical protein